MATAGMQRRYTLILDQDEARQTAHALREECSRLTGTDDGTIRYRRTLTSVLDALDKALDIRGE